MPIGPAEREDLRAASSGDRGAIERLLTPEVDRVYAVCLRMVGRREPAADLAQESLTKAIRALPEFDGRSEVATWLTRIAINTCLSWLRTKKRSGRDPRHEVTVDPAIEQAAEPPPAWSVQWEERRRLVAAAMDNLSPDHRAVLVLRDVRGLDYDQMADVLGVATGTIKSRLFRARTALRHEIEKFEQDDAAATIGRAVDIMVRPGAPGPQTGDPS